MTAARVPAPVRHAPIVDRLTHEWRHLTIRAIDLRVVRSWNLPGPELSSLDDVLDRCGFLPAPERGSTPASRRIRRERGDADDRAHDAYLLRVLTIARTEPLAARIVLQRILPALSSLARRHSTTVHAQHDLLDELVANSWCSIRSYPIERRPQRIVSNLVRDIGFQTIVRPNRRRDASELPSAHEHLRDTEHVVTTDPLEEMIELLTDARRRGMDDGDVDLICQLVSLRRAEHVAVVMGVTPRTVRNHRDAIVHRLRIVAGVAA